MKMSVTIVQYVLLQLGGEAKKILRLAGGIRQRKIKQEDCMEEVRRRHREERIHVEDRGRT